MFKGDPADKAGIQAGDVVTEINGRNVKDTHDLLLMIASMRVDDRISIKVLRDGVERTIQVVVEERTESKEMARARSRDEKQGFGITVQDITPQVAPLSGDRIAERRAGGGCTGGEPGGRSRAAAPGHHPPGKQGKGTSVKEYQREVSKKSDKNTVLLLIKRGRSTFYVALRK